jgi:hypothetical protein
MTLDHGPDSTAGHSNQEDTQMTSTTPNRRRLVVGGLLLSIAAIAAIALPAATLAKDGDIRRSASCSASSTVKLKIGARDGGFEVEGGVDQDRNGRSWNWTMKNDGTRFASGTGVTRAPSGSFSVERRTSNSAGSDTIVFRAVNPASGEVCRIAATV